MFHAPKFSMVSKRQVEIPFIASIPAGAGVPFIPANLTLIVGPFSYKFRVVNAKMVFTGEAMNLVRHYWLVSGNRSISATGIPSGDNIFSREAPASYFIGKGIVRNVSCNYVVDEAMQYIKLHTVNGLVNAYDINCSITVEEL